MPNVPSTPIKAQRPAPYSTSPTRSTTSAKPNSSPSSDEDIKPKTSPKKARIPARGWTAEETKAIFAFVSKNGAAGSAGKWEGVVPGRTGTQGHDQWRQVLVPYLNKALDSKGKGSGSV